MLIINYFKASFIHPHAPNDVPNENTLLLKIKYIFFQKNRQ